MDEGSFKRCFDGSIRVIYYVWRRGLDKDFGVCHKSITFTVRNPKK